MKRIEKIKKTLATLLAMVLVLGMSVTAQAENHKPVPGDSAEITVYGVKPGATVKAYKIATGTWNNEGFTGYEGISFDTANGTVKIEGEALKNPAPEDLTAIANAVKNTETQAAVLVGSDGGDKGWKYTSTLPVGMYLILVTQNGTDDVTAYNPMIASVYYTSDRTGQDNEALGGSVDAATESYYDVEGSVAWAKSMNPEISKEIVSPVESETNKYGNDTTIGDVITFKVETAFPGYSDEYTEVDFNIVDTLSAGMDFVTDTDGNTVITSMEVGAEKDAATDKYTVTNSGDGNRTMTIAFDSDYILAHRGDAVVVQYQAKLNANAGINFDRNTNTVKAEYTNNPTSDGTGTTEEKRTYHYTFGIDASINGNWNEITKELLKTGEEVVNGETRHDVPLNGATFTLTEAERNSENKLVPVTDGSVHTTISGVGEVGKDVNENGEALPGKSVLAEKYAGYLKFTGLDAGEYILQETKAPAGYSLNAAEIPVKITAVYDETTGLLTSYTIEVDGRVVEEKGQVKDSSYTATYTKDETTGNVTDMNAGGNTQTQPIPNTKIIELPSTGGIGTTIFTIGGCAIMIIAAGLYFASRRKKTQ